MMIWYKTWMPNWRFCLRRRGPGQWLFAFARWRCEFGSAYRKMQK